MIFPCLISYPVTGMRFSFGFRHASAARRLPLAPCTPAIPNEPNPKIGHSAKRSEKGSDAFVVIVQRILQKAPSIVRVAAVDDNSECGITLLLTTTNSVV